MGEKKSYRLVNLAVLLATLALLAVILPNLTEMLTTEPPGLMVTLLITVLAVHGIKGFRLYFELYEKRMPKGLFIRQYCKVMPASMLIPFKLGDIYRAYCFGWHIKDYMAGLAVIVLDRFVDTMALLTIMLVFSLFYAVQLGLLFYLLVFVLFVLLIFYGACPGMCRYWKRYFLQMKATKRNLLELRLVMEFQRAYEELQAVVRGKFLLVYLLSLAAWGVELGGLLISCQLFFDLSRSELLGRYLSGALFGMKPMYLSGFIGMSVIVLLLAYLTAAGCFLMRKEVTHDQDPGNI